MAAILDSGKTKKDIKIKTSPGWIEYGGYKTNDFRDYGTLNLSDIISYSSNVGMVKLCMEQDSGYLVDIYSGFGIGFIPANILIPAREGFLPEASSLSDRDKVSSCYGYGLSMSAVQIAQAYQVFANDGVLKYLRSIGFETFPEMFDESYDDEKNTLKRFNIIFDEIEKLSKMNIDEIHQKFVNTLPKIKHNHELLLKFDREELLLNVLKEISNV